MDIEKMRQLLKKHLPGHADMVARTMVAEKYYQNQNDILFRKPKTTEETENPLRSADNRVPRNFYGLLVNQKAAYTFTAPPLFDVGNPQANERIAQVLGDSYAKNCKDLCVAAANSGVAWIHFWKDDEGNFHYGVPDSKGIIPIWSGDLERRLLGVIRSYRLIDESGECVDVYEYWNDVECHSFSKPVSDADFGLLSPYQQFWGCADEGAPNNIYRHEMGRVPFIAFANNNLFSSDLENVKHHIDVYDQVYSGFVNDLEDIQEVIFLLTNYDGTNLHEFLGDLKKFKTVKLQSSGVDDKSGLQTLTIDIPVEAREKMLDITRKAIFEQGQGVDPQPQDFGNASGVALKYLYSLLELKAGLMETEFRCGFGELVRAICRHEGLAVGAITQTWTRTAITNDSELATICQQSVGVISAKSILKNHPFVENADDEERQLAKERGAREMDVYKDAFASGGDDDGQQ